MIFQHTLDKVLNGTKTQTRRIVQPGDTVLNYWRNPISSFNAGGCEIGVVKRNGRDLWQAFNSYAVQMGRGKPAVARMLIRYIRREDVRCISHEDVIAEGFGDETEFLKIWIAMHDKSALDRYIKSQDGFDRDMYLAGRPAERYDAWALTFAVVERVAL